MTRRTPRPDFRHHLTPDARRNHVEQMGEIRRYLVDLSSQLYPLTPEHNVFSKLKKDIDAHVEYWTGNPRFYHSGQQARQWYINDN